MKLELAIMIEGQNGLNWERWKRLVPAVESLGFVGLYRSDHYTNAKQSQLTESQSAVSSALLWWLPRSSVERF